jgi:hypothetical protein
MTATLGRRVRDRHRLRVVGLRPSAESPALDVGRPGRSPSCACAAAPRAGASGRVIERVAARLKPLGGLADGDPGPLGDERNELLGPTRAAPPAPDRRKGGGRQPARASPAVLRSPSSSAVRRSCRLYPEQALERGERLPELLLLYDQRFELREPAADRLGCLLDQDRLQREGVWLSGARRGLARRARRARPPGRGG